MNVMEVNEEVARERLRMENPEYRKWEEEHENLEQTLETFEAHRYLTPEQQLERKRVQKLKLAAKDRMMELVRRTRSGQA
jgi:hypothetical protein